MKTLFTLLLATLCAATGYGQTIKSLGYNTTNGQVVYSGTNTLTFTNAVLWNANVSAVDLGADNLTVEGAIYFTEALTNIAVTRTNLGFPLQALTNTSNLTMMRALAGSTNTNEPFSGSFQWTDPDDSLTYTATVSNGIILRVEEY